MQTALHEHLNKLHRIADGAMRVGRERKMETKWWDGYRQALDDISDFVEKEARGVTANH
jgi:hypothetical protein